ncbi:hypothetical protein IAR50_003557 [Cryptococcus sp. DSM 104548]
MQERNKRRKTTRGDDPAKSKGKPASAKVTPPKKAPVAPLRRGDACLRCRAKKLKCNANKPECDQCSKRADSCVYDIGRPATRIEKLEAELAQLDDSTTTAPSENRPSTSSYESSNSQGLVTPYTTAPASNSSNSLPYVHETMYSHPYRGSGTPDPAAGLYTRQVLGIPGEMGYAATTGSSPDFGAGTGKAMDGGYGDHFRGWTWPPAGLGLNWNSTQQVQAASPGYVAPLGQSPFTVPHGTGSAGESNYWSPTRGGQENGAAAGGGAVGGLGLGDDGLARMSMSSLGTYPTQMDFTFANRPSVSTPLPIAPQRQTSLPAIPGFMGLPPPTQAETAVAKDDKPPEKELTEGDVSQSARDYLLNLFFCPDPPRCRFGSECFTEAQFHHRLSLPPACQPHPALLFSMYTIAASTSYIPAIKRLEGSLYGIAVGLVERALREVEKPGEGQGEGQGGREGRGVGEGEQGRRLVDVVNASKNLSKWLFTKGRDLEGFVWSSKAISLAVACELHKIPSSNLQENQSKSSDSLLPPPRTQWELCERIHAFWSAWGNERARRLRTPWPSLLRDEMIITPLPRPPDDYLNGTILQVPDITIRTLYTAPLKNDPRPLNSLYSFLFASLHLFHRASTVSNREIESPMSYRLLAALDGEGVGERSPREAYPDVCAEIEGMCEWVEGVMPGRWNVRASSPGQGGEGEREGEGEGWKDQDAPVISLLLICTRIHLLSAAHQADHQNFLQLVDRASDLVGKWMDKMAAAEKEGQGRRGSVALGSKGSCRNKHGLCGPYRASLFEYVVDKLGECEGIAMKAGDGAEALRYREKAVRIDGGNQKLRKCGSVSL